jgi:hypothetical protein
MAEDDTLARAMMAGNNGKLSEAEATTAAEFAAV